MVGGDEVTVERWTVGEQLLKQEIEKEETQEEKEECKKEKPGFILMLLGNIIDTVLMEEVHRVGTKMNRYRGVLAKAVLKFADEHEDDEADLDRLVDSFRAGWKVYREKEDEKATVDTFMNAMNNRLWVQEGVDAA